jgi:hypothetical protein
MRILLATLLLLGITSAQAQHNKQDQYLVIDDQHIVTFSPLSGMIAYDYFNPCVSLDYEYVFNREMGLGLYIPLVFGYEGPEQDAIYNTEYYKHKAVYTAPGIRFHAPIRHGRGAFTTGPGILLGTMHFRPSGDYNNGGHTANPFDYSLTGIIADNSLDFYKQHFIFGLKMRTGWLFETHDGNRFFLEFGLHFGGKF